MRQRYSNNLSGHTIRAAAYLACACLAFVAQAAAASEVRVSPQPDVLHVPGKVVEPISPIQHNKHENKELVKLGELLFHDERLDSNRQTSCATCHDLKFGGTDQLAFSVNSAGKSTHFNTPTIFNVSLNSQYYWSGQFDSLDAQVDDALKEINTNWPTLLRTLKGIPRYVKLFSTLYSDGITRENVTDAFVKFERSLLTPGSPFDRFLMGDKQAITSSALQGYKLFKSYGCITCHQGSNIGGNVVINLKKMSASFGRLNSVRQRVNGKLQYIRVPGLRNVAVTPPYFHDGSVTTLYQAVQRMIDEYSGMEVPDTNVYNIVSFLRSLTGQYKGESL